MAAFLRLAVLAGARIPPSAPPCTHTPAKLPTGPGSGGGASPATRTTTPPRAPRGARASPGGGPPAPAPPPPPAGAGGGQGGSGGPPPPQFDCSTWKSPAHQQLATTEPSPGATLEEPIVVAADQDHPLVFVRQQSAAGGPTL